MDYTFRPLQHIGRSTPPAERRSRWTFKAGWADTLKLLAYELDLLDAKHIVVEADFREADLRQDGMPRANARPPEHPGVRIAFDSKHGPLTYATDTHAFWQHNVRAVALSLQALRSVDRYGVTKNAEQYTGWKQIGAGPSSEPGWSMDRKQAAVFMADASAPNGPGGATNDALVRALLDGELIDSTYKAAARRLHPDTGGNTADFQRLQHALRILRQR